MFSFEILHESWKSNGFEDKYFPNSLALYYFSHAYGLAYVDYQYAENNEYENMNRCLENFNKTIEQFKLSNKKLVEINLNIENFDQLIEELNFYSKSLSEFNSRIMKENNLNLQDIYDKFLLKVLFYSFSYKYDLINGKINKNKDTIIQELHEEFENLKPKLDVSNINYRKDISEWIDLSWE